MNYSTSYQTNMLKHYLTMIGAIVSIPFILTPALCMENEDPARGQIISTMIFVTGIVTFIQCTWGCRLPLVQVIKKTAKNQFPFFSSNIVLGWNDFISRSNTSHFKSTRMEMSESGSDLPND